jgi:hypothetical protein
MIAGIDDVAMITVYGKAVFDQVTPTHPCTVIAAHDHRARDDQLPRRSARRRPYTVIIRPPYRAAIMVKSA